MGLNYYLVQGEPCPHCRRYPDNATRIHLGKKSSGWRFIFRGWEYGKKPWDVDNELSYGAINDVPSWCWLVQSMVLNGWRVIDETGAHFSLTELLIAVFAEMKGRMHGVEHPKNTKVDQWGQSFSFEDFS